MQKKLSKVLALLSCIAMLCALLPMGILSVSAAADFFVNGDFETGDLTGYKSGYSGSIVSSPVHGGNYAHKTTNTASKYQGMMQINPIDVVPNSDYTVTFWYYYEGSNATGSGASFYLYAQTTDNKTNIKSITNYPKAANTWYQVTHTFNSGANSQIALVWSNRMANDGGTYYFDDVVMTGPVPTAGDEPVVNPVPESFGRIENGGFEEATGGLTLKYASRTTEQAYSGNYSLKGTSQTKYGVYASTKFDCVANSDYTFSFKIKLAGDHTSSSTNQRLYIKTADEATTLKQLNITDATTDWKTYSVTVNSGANTGLYFSFAQGIDNGGTCYIDDVIVEGPAPADEPENNVTPDAEVSGNLVANGHFNDGTATGWTLSGGAVEAYDGDYMLKATTSGKYDSVAKQTISVEANADYTLDVNALYVGAATKATARVHVYAGNGSGSNDLVSIYYWTIYPGQVSAHQLSFNTDSNTQVTINVQQYASDGTTTNGNIYYDDFVMLKKAVTPEGNVTPSNDGYLINGDFETGDLTGWTVSKGGEVVYDVVASGKFALMGTATAKYDAFVSQKVTVEANTDYLITFKAKLAASGGQPRLEVKGNGTRLNNDCYYFTGSTEWQTFQVFFNSGSNTTVDVLPTQGVSNGGNVYYDDFVMEKAKVGYNGQYPETMTSGADIRFMTYNVLCGQDTENGGYSWGSDITGRPEKAFAMVNYYKPDVIAFEEFSGEWYDAFNAQMTDYALGEMTSKDSQNNGKLYTCLAYNKNTIRLIETKLFRNTVSRWGTQGMRYVNVAVFEVIATGERFIAAALHPDAGKLVGDQDLNKDGKAEEGDGYWRQFQLEEAAEYLNGLSAEYQLPLIVGGDFNSGLDGTYEDNVSWYKFADVGFTDATAGRYIDHIMYNGMATHLYETTVADAAVLSASDHKAVFADIQFLDEFATPIKTAKDAIKTQGRTTLKDGAMWLDYSASGIEFSANCEGTVALNLTVNSIKNTDATYGGLYFTVIVDGVKKDRAECRITSTGSVQLVLAENLSKGNHTFEVYRQTEHRGAEVGITSVVMNGSFNAKPANNRLYIEFIGDSISTGYGALGVAGDDQADSPLWQDATVAYPYLTAKALNADFSDVCYSGLGCKYGYSGSLSMQTVYTAQRYQYDKITQYNFNARQPDVVVIALGTNDIANQEDAALRKAGYQEMLELVRAKNPEAKIVWIYGMMKDNDNEMIASLIEENGGAAKGLYSLELTTNTSGAGWHPSAAGQQKFADELVSYLNSDVLVRYVEDAIVDEYEVLDYEGSSRMEMTSDRLGLAFLFTINADGIVKGNKNYKADLTNATIDAFDDGGSYKLLKMGAILTNDPNVGMGDMTLEDVDNNRTKDVNATYLWGDPEAGSAQYAVRITNVPVGMEKAMIYARAYYVFEYEGRQITVYGERQAANYAHKYDSNDGAFEW